MVLLSELERSFFSVLPETILSDLKRSLVQLLHHTLLPTYTIIHNVFSTKCLLFDVIFTCLYLFLLDKI